MNKIYINARFLTQPVTGVQRFALEICKELIKLRADIIFLTPPIHSEQVPEGFNIEQIGQKNGLYWEQIELPHFLKKQGNPLLINLCNRGPLFYSNNIIVIHDVTFLRYPKTVSWKFSLLYRFMIPILLKKAKKILTVSEFSKKEILHFYPKIKTNIEVIYNGVNKNFVIGKEDKDNYLLAVSSDYGHKNFESLIKAFLQLNDPLIKLKIVGSKGKIATKYQNENNIEFLGRVDDEQLITLYQRALAFVFPSLYEGFGIPPLEAQACGCVVLSSSNASMPEVLGKSALYFNPLDVNDMVQKIKNIKDDDELRIKFINEGIKNIKRFSWYDSAITLNGIIKKIEDNDEF